MIVNVTEDVITSQVGPVQIGWSNCGECKAHIRNCRCPNGPHEPKSFAKMRADDARSTTTSVAMPSSVSATLSVGSDTVAVASSAPSSTSVGGGVGVTCKIGSHQVDEAAADRNDDGTWTCHAHQATAAARG